VRGSMLKSGDVVIAKVHFTDSDESKIRPALVLFEEFGNVIVAGITTNMKMNGIPISVKDGAAQDSIIKLNYILTITNEAILKTVFHLNKTKSDLVFNELVKKLNDLKG
jgi:mRNA interferase MazF